MKARFPRYGEPWGQCGICGSDFPVSVLRLHPRFGWQCAEHPPGFGDWDGGPHRDELYYVPRPFEGTRKTTAPLTNTLTEGVPEGVAQAAPPGPVTTIPPGQPATNPYIFRDQVVSGNFWELQRAGGRLIVAGVAATSQAVAGWNLGLGWFVSVRSSRLTVSSVAVSGAIANPTGSGISVTSDGRLRYVPQ